METSNSNITPQCSVFSIDGSFGTKIEEPRHTGIQKQKSSPISSAKEPNKSKINSKIALWLSKMKMTAIMVRMH